MQSPLSRGRSSCLIVRTRFSRADEGHRTQNRSLKNEKKNDDQKWRCNGSRKRFFRILAATVSASPLVWSRKGQGWLQTFTHGRVEATEPAVSQSLRSQHHSSRLSAFCKGNWRSPAFGMNCFAGQYNVIVKAQRSCLKWMSTTYLPLKARRFARFSFSFSPVSIASSQILAELEGAACRSYAPTLPAPFPDRGNG